MIFLKSCLRFFMFLSFVGLQVAQAQTFMRHQGERGSQSALSLGQMFRNLIVQQRASTMVYAIGSYGIGTSGASGLGGIGFRRTREEAAQFYLEAVGGQTFLRVQGSADLVPFDLNVPLIGSPVAQTILQALENNISQGLRNWQCDSAASLPGQGCYHDDAFSQGMDLANNRRTTGYGLRFLVGAEGQYLHQIATASPAGSYLILSPSVLINVLHVDYRSLQNNGLSSLAIRIGGAPLAGGIATNGSEGFGGAGGLFRADVEFVVHLGRGHFIGLELLYRYFSAYHGIGGNRLNAIHSLRSAVSYGFWPGHRRGQGVGYFIRPGYEFNGVDLTSDTPPPGAPMLQETSNQFFGATVGVEF